MHQPRVASESPVATPAPSSDPDPFRSLLPTLCGLCLGSHAAFLALFLLAGVPAMAVANVASILWYALVLRLVLGARTKPIVEFGLIAAEVVGHAFLATAILGWDSGFHYYVLLVVPVTALGTMRPAWLKSAAMASAGLAYLALDIWLRGRAAPHLLSPPALQGLYYFNLLATLLLLAVLAGRYYLLITQTQAALQVMARTDGLTQLPNRGSITRTVELHQARASQGHALSFIMCDIDNFKRVNDRGGHSAGDEVLQIVSRSMAASLRSADIIGRWGGEEFLVVLPDTDTPEAAMIAERLRLNVAATHIQGSVSPITITIGLATSDPGESATDTIARADAALYDGKRAGRNRVVTAPGPPGPTPLGGSPGACP